MDSPSNLTELLAQLNDTCLTVKNHLHEEQTALTNRDSNLISQTAKQKHHAITHLNRCISELNIALKKLGHDQNSSVGSFIVKKLNNQHILSLWQQCDANIKECDRINRSNSSLVSSGIQQTMLALNFLSSSMQGELNYHYDKSGIQANKLSYGMNVKA